MKILLVALYLGCLLASLYIGAFLGSARSDVNGSMERAIESTYILHELREKNVDGAKVLIWEKLLASFNSYGSMHGKYSWFEWMNDYQIETCIDITYILRLLNKRSDLAYLKKMSTMKGIHRLSWLYRKNKLGC